MRLRLRPLHDGDALETSRLITPAVSRWTATWPESIGPLEAAHRIEAVLQEEIEGAALVRAIERTADNALIGWIGLHKASPSASRAALGYWLGELFHGQGYMREAASTFVPLAWRPLAIEVIEAGAQLDNSASISILRRLGMRYTDTRTEFTPNRQRWEACAYFELARPD